MLIVISGIDGTGKTLQVNMLENWYQMQGKRVAIVKAYSDDVKIACRHFVDTWTNQMAIMFLFQALHAQQYTAAMNALQKGEVVIADRWDESYLAYHSCFGVLAEQQDLRNRLNEMAFRNVTPDYGFVITVPAEVARKRRLSRGKVERLEDRDDQYYETIQAAYCRIACQRKWQIIDGTKTPEEIHQKITKFLEKMVKAAVQ